MYYYYIYVIVIYNIFSRINAENSLMYCSKLQIDQFYTRTSFLLKNPRTFDIILIFVFILYLLLTWNISFQKKFFNY